MKPVEIIIDLIKQKGITKNKMLRDIGLNPNSFQNWEKHGTIPSGKTLSKIAEYFNVSVDYLLDKNSDSTIKISSNNDQKILDLLHQLSKEDQIILINMAQSFVDTRISQTDKILQPRRSLIKMTPKKG